MTSRYLLRVKACSSYPTCGDGVLVEWIRWIYQMRIHHALSRTLAAPAGSHVATASPAAVKCADCSVTDGLCEYAGSKGESFHLCPGCYRYRVTENPAAKFKRVSGAPEAEDRKAGWLEKLTVGGVATALSTDGLLEASDIGSGTNCAIASCQVKLDQQHVHAV